MAMGSYLSIITLNVNELNSAINRQRLAKWIQKQAKIGTLSAGDNPDDYQLHFEVWFGTINQDPEAWFAK